MSPTLALIVQREAEIDTFKPVSYTHLVEIWKRFRKWGGIPTGITQNVKDLLSSREVELSLIHI